MDHLIVPADRSVAVSGRILFPTGTVRSFTGEEVLSFSGQTGVRDGMLLGSVLARQYSVLLHDRNAMFTAGLSLYGARVEACMDTGNGTVPLAVFFVTGVSRQDGSAFLTLTGTDALGSLMDGIWQDDLSYPCTLRQIADRALGQAGLSLAADFPLQDQRIAQKPDWGEISLRGVLAYTAQACGCFCRMDGEGRAVIQPVWNREETPWAIFPENTFKREYGEASFGPLKGISVRLHGSKNTAEPVTVQTDETPLDGFNSITIENNPLFPADDASSPVRIRQLLARLEGMAFTRLLVHWQGDPRLQPGQRIRVYDTRGGYTNSCITSLGFAVDNGFSMQTDCTFQKPASALGRIFTPSGGLNAAMLQGTSDGAFLKAESITAQHLAAQAVTAEKLDAGSVTAEKIAAGEVETKHLAAQAVTAEKLAAQAVTAEKIGAGEINASHIRGKSITAGQLAAGLITADSGLIDQGAIGTAQIADGSITEAKIVSLNADVIQSGTLHTDRLLLTGEGGVVYEINAASSGLTQSELDREEYRQKIDGSVLVARSVTADQIAAQTITANELLSGAVTTDKLDAHAVTAEKLAAHSVTANKLASDVGSSLDLSSNKSIQLMVNRTEAAIQDHTGQQMTISFDGGNAVEKERQSLTARVHVWKNGEEITSSIPAEAFTWEKESDQETDAAWAERNAGKTTVTLSRADIGKSCRISCTVDAGQSYGKFVILDGQLMWTGTDVFRMEKGDLFGDGDTYVLRDGRVYRKNAPGKMTVTTTAFDHSVLENSGLKISDDGVHIFTGGAFTVDSGNFTISDDGSVEIKGTVTAEDGEIGGWKIVPGSLQSGEGQQHVRLSTEDAVYGIWAGADRAEDAPFRVARDGTVYLTKMYVTDDKGNAQANPVNLRTSYWKMDRSYARSVQTLEVSDGELRIVLQDGTGVNFKKAGYSGLELRQNDPQGRNVFVYNPASRTYNVQKTVEVYDNGVYLGLYSTVNEDSGTEAYQDGWNAVTVTGIARQAADEFLGGEEHATRVYIRATASNGDTDSDSFVVSGEAAYALGETAGKASGEKAGWNACIDACNYDYNAKYISEYAPGELYMRAGNQYTGIGSSWVKVSNATGLYRIPGKK